MCLRIWCCGDRGDWRRLHNEQLNDFYSSPNYFAGDKIENIEMGWACGAYG